MVSPGWPVELVHGDVGVRALRMRDVPAWSESRIRNAEWLAPWEGRSPSLVDQTWEERHSVAAGTLMVRTFRRESRAGRMLPFAITHGGRFVGQVTASGITRNAFCSTHLGYWVDGAVAGQGIVPTAVALVVDHLFGPVGLHRVEANIRPENAPSLAVVRKLGFRHEGTMPRYLFIDGDWRDHHGFALTVEDVAAEGGLLARWISKQKA